MSAPQFIRTPPCVLQGAPSPVQATGRTLRWGVVATGRIAGRVTEDIARLEDAVLQAVSSRSEATADRKSVSASPPVITTTMPGARGTASSSLTRKWMLSI